MKLNCMRKLRSESGVSLSVALLFFVVCAALASMILAAAYAASGRVTSRMTLNQDQYAVDSAASLIAKELQSDVIVIQQTAQVKQNEDGSYTVQEQKTADGKDSTISTSYYEVNYDASGNTEVPTTLEDFDSASVKNVTDEDTQSLLVKEYAGMFTAYIGNYSDATKKIYQANFANAGLDTPLKGRTSSFDITVGSDTSLNAHADMTLASDLSLDIAVTSKNASIHVSSIHVYCAPQITTSYRYMVTDEGDVNGVQTVIKTTVISFGKAKVTRS